jgi:hypothetical protein
MNQAQDNRYLRVSMKMLYILSETLISGGWARPYRCEKKKPWTLEQLTAQELFSFISDYQIQQLNIQHHPYL